MRIGLKATITGEDNEVDQLCAVATAAERAGLAAVYVPQGFGLDALTALAAVAVRVPRIELGVTVVPVQTRHVVTAAGQAKTLQAASDGRALLGVGASHAGYSERYGVPFTTPAAQVEEYLEALGPLVRSVDVSVVGDHVTANTVGVRSDVVGATSPVPVVVGALGPRMLRAAGALADGTVTFMAGPRTLGDRIVPTVVASAEEAGRPRPRVIAGLNVAVTDDPDRVRGRLADELAWVKGLESYRRLLADEGVSDAGGIAAVGDWPTVERHLGRLAGLRVTDINATLVGDDAEQRRTLAALGDYSG